MEERAVEMDRLERVSFNTGSHKDDISEGSQSRQDNWSEHIDDVELGGENVVEIESSERFSLKSEPPDPTIGDAKSFQENQHGRLGDEKEELVGDDQRGFDSPSHVAGRPRAMEPLGSLGRIAGDFRTLVRQKGIFGCCSPQRAFLLTNFFVFNVVFILADIVTDVLGGLSLISQGHIYWGTATLTLPFVPFAAYSLSEMVSHCRNRRGRRGGGGGGRTEEDSHRPVIHASLHLPFMQPIVNFLQFLKLLSMDTDSSHNSQMVEQIQRQAGWLGFYEAFLESGPQFILQLAIVMRFGYITYSQALSMPLSFISLCLAAARAYHHQRVEPLADPNPPFLKSLLLVLPSYLVVNLTYVLSWAVIFAHLRALTLPMVFASAANNWLLIKVFHIEDALMDQKSEADRGQADHISIKSKKEVSNLKTNSIFTSILSPCVVGSHKVNMLALSGLSTSLCLALWLQCIVLVLQSHPFDPDNNPPISYCFKPDPSRNLSTDLEAGVFSAFQLCSDCESHVRRCVAGENPLDILLLAVIPVLNVLLVVSFLLCCLLQWLSDYSNVFRLTHALSFGRGGYLHRSLLCSLAESGDHEGLERVLSTAQRAAAATGAAVNRQDSLGDTPLHIATARGFPKCVRVLLRHNARCVADAAGRMPQHLATREGRTICLRMICERASESTLAATDLMGMTALDYAIKHDQEQCARILLTTGNADPGRDCNILHLACLKCDVESPENEENENILERPSRKENVYKKLTRDRKTLQALRAKNGVLKVLLADMATVQKRRQSTNLLCLGRDSGGQTPMHYAARLGQVENLLRMLLFLKTHPNKIDILSMTDDEGKTPLHLAIEATNLMCCVILIDYQSMTKSSFSITWDAKKGDLEDYVQVVRDVLLGSTLNTLLHYSVQRRCLKACQILLLQNSQEGTFRAKLGSLTADKENGFKSVNFYLLRACLKADAPDILKLFLERIEEGEKSLTKLIQAPARSPYWYQDFMRHGGQTSSLLPRTKRYTIKMLLECTGEGNQNEEHSKLVSDLVEGYKSLLHSIVSQGRFSMLLAFLETIGRFPEAIDLLLLDDSGHLDGSFLEVAVRRSGRECCVLLVDYCKRLVMDSSSVEQSSRPWLLELCVMSDRADVLQFILDAYSREGFDVAAMLDSHVDDRTGHSLVYKATTGGCADSLKVLLEFGAAGMAWKQQSVAAGSADFKGMVAVLYEAIKTGDANLLFHFLSNLNAKGITTGENLVRLREALSEVQLEGRRPLAATAALRGHTAALALLLREAPQLLQPEISLEVIEREAENGSLFYRRTLKKYKDIVSA